MLGVERGFFFFLGAICFSVVEVKSQEVLYYGKMCIGTSTRGNQGSECQCPF